MREAKVLSLLMEGFTNGDIAIQLRIPVHTVKKDVGVLMQRYEARNRVSLVVSVWKLDQEKLGKCR